MTTAPPVASPQCTRPDTECRVTRDVRASSELLTERCGGPTLMLATLHRLWRGRA